MWCFMFSQIPVKRLHFSSSFLFFSVLVSGGESIYGRPFKVIVELDFG